MTSYSLGLMSAPAPFQPYQFPALSPPEKGPSQQPHEAEGEGPARTQIPTILETFLALARLVSKSVYNYFPRRVCPDPLESPRMIIVSVPLQLLSMTPSHLPGLGWSRLHHPSVTKI